MREEVWKKVMVVVSVLVIHTPILFGNDRYRIFDLT